MSRTTVVYLTGFGRSGSTLVERILGAVPGWVNVGELVDLSRSVAPSDELCGCGEPFSECPHWTHVGEVAFGGWTPEVLDRLTWLQRASARQRHLPGLLAGRREGRHGRRPETQALADLRSAYTRIYQAVADVTGAQVVVDASKGPALGAALAGAPELDVRLLNVVRDPRAVAWSWHRHVERPHARRRSGPGGAQMWRIPVHRSAAQWSALQLEVEAIGRFGGAPSTRVRYEDVVGDPVGTLVQASAALGLELAPADLPTVTEAGVVLSPSHGLSGNPGRFRSGALPLRRDDGWLTAMPAASKAVVTALTLPLLKKYGYPAGSRSSAAGTPASPHAVGSST
jgi:hypothetical protein